MTLELRSYQRDLVVKCLDVLRRLHIVYLSAEVRVGKTLTALHIAGEYGARAVLFVTKKKAIKSIENDFALSGLQYKLTVTNYEQVKKLDPNEYDFIVADEAQNLKKFPKPSLRAKEMFRIVGYRPLVLLSGTPSVESFSDMFHQFQISMYSPFRNYRNFYAWAKDFVNVEVVQHGQFQVNDYSGARKEDVLNAIQPYMVAFTQADAGFKCPVIERVHYVESSVIPQMIRDLFKKKIINLPEDDVCIADTAASLIIKMHQISSGTVIGDKKTHRFCTAKAEYIKNKFVGKKIAIYYKFQAEFDLLKEYFPNYTVVPEEFQESEDKVFLAQIISGREGIALHTADAIIFYAIDFAAQSYWQSRARLQTLNRTKPAEVHWIFTKGGIENKILSAVVAKKDFTLAHYCRTGGYWYEGKRGTEEIIEVLQEV